MDRDWGGLRRKSGIVRPRILRYPGIKEGGVGRGAEGARDVGGEGSVFEVGDRRGSGVDG